MKKHLRILYGCDDRFDIVINTAKVCEKHFDSIVILNSGPKEFYERLKNNVSSNIEVKQLEKFLEIESCRRAMIEDVPTNEWVLWLDADERPSPELLNNLDDVLKLADEDNYNIIRLIWCEHTEGIRIPVYTPLPKTHEEFVNKFSGHYFMPLRLVKKQEGISVASNFGAHELFVLNNEKVMYKVVSIDNDGLERLLAEPMVPVKQIVSSKNRVEKYNLITFGYNSSNVNETNNYIIDDIKGNINDNSTLTIKGYTDQTGTAAYNRQLSLRRAEEISHYFQSNKIITKGVGFDEILYPLQFPEGRFYSRTVNIMVDTIEDSN